MIYYFSGSGNSRAIAKALGSALTREPKQWADMRLPNKAARDLCCRYMPGESLLLY